VDGRMLGLPHGLLVGLFLLIPGILISLGRGLPVRQVLRCSDGVWEIHQGLRVHSVAILRCILRMTGIASDECDIVTVVRYVEKTN
jgi:hypothetical protein